MVCAVAWVCSILLTVKYNGPEGSSASLARGRFSVSSRYGDFVRPMTIGNEEILFHRVLRSRMLGRLAQENPVGWYLQSGGHSIGIVRPIHVEHRAISYGIPLQQTVVEIALWFPFTLVALASAILWLCDRRRIPTGRCEWCGYDLTKNESGRCPECGVEVEGDAMREGVSSESNVSSAAPPGRNG